MKDASASQTGPSQVEPVPVSPLRASVPSANSTKTLADVMADMSALYEQVRAGDCDLRVASELSNITGKYLKAAQLDFAKELWLERQNLNVARLSK